MVRNGAPPAMMETTFYDEHSYAPLGAPVSHLKRNMTLDLNGRSNKRPRYGNLNNNNGGQQPYQGAPVLSSPDLQMLKLHTPDMEKFILSQNSLVTPTPTSQILFPPMPTEAQVNYARGFEDALNELHHSDSSQGPFPAVDTLGNHVPTYTNLDRLDRLPQPSPYGASFHDHITVKDEPQTVPSCSSSPPLSPIDMENQEKIKLERKRQRNRLAASKCRRRKLERISRLEDKVKALKSENSELGSVVLKLKQHVSALKEQVMEHVNSGCRITNSNF